MLKKILSLLVLALSVNFLSAQILVSTGAGGNYDIASYPGNFTGYYDGFSVTFRANSNNPASYAKLRIGAFAQIDIYNTAGTLLSAGDIKINQIVTLVYSAAITGFQMITTSGNMGGGGGPPAGLVTLLYADEADATGGPGGQAGVKSYVVPANTYARIMVEAEYSATDPGIGDSPDCSFSLVFGGTVKETGAIYTNAADPNLSGTVKFSEVLPGPSTVQIDVSGGGGPNVVWKVKSFRVYGVY